MLECNETEAARHRVVAEMDMVVGREGTVEDKGAWSQLSGQRFNSSAAIIPGCRWT